MLFFKCKHQNCISSHKFTISIIIRLKQICNFVISLTLCVQFIYFKQKMEPKKEEEKTTMPSWLYFPRACYAKYNNFFLAQQWITMQPSISLYSYLSDTCNGNLYSYEMRLFIFLYLSRLKVMWNVHQHCGWCITSAAIDYITKSLNISRTIVCRTSLHSCQHLHIGCRFQYRFCKM